MTWRDRKAWLKATPEELRAIIADNEPTPGRCGYDLFFRQVRQRLARIFLKRKGHAV